MRVFISHSSVDSETAAALDDALRHPPGLNPWDQRLQSWLDTPDINAGNYYADDIMEGLQASDAAVFLLTDASLASQEVRREWVQAKAHGVKLIPFVPDHGVLGRLPRDWQYEVGICQAKEWISAQWVAAEIYRTLGLPAGDCPCGSGRTYAACHGRARTESLPTQVHLSTLLERRNKGLPLGVCEDGEILTFVPEDRHLHCLGDSQSGKTSLLSLWLAAGQVRLPLAFRALVSSTLDAEAAASLRLDALIVQPRQHAVVHAAVERALAEGRPVQLALDDVEQLPTAWLAALLDHVGDESVSMAVAQYLPTYRHPEVSALRALTAPVLQIQLDAQAPRFGVSSSQPSITGRATVWSPRWAGPRSAQIATR